MFPDLSGYADFRTEHANLNTVGLAILGSDLHGREMKEYPFIKELVYFYKD